MKRKVCIAIVVALFCICSSVIAAKQAVSSGGGVGAKDEALSKLPPPESDAPIVQKKDGQADSLDELIKADRVYLEYGGAGYLFTSGSFRNGGTVGNETLDGGIKGGWGIATEYGKLEFHKMQNFAIVTDYAKEWSYQYTSQSYASSAGNYNREFNYWYAGGWQRLGVSIGGVNNNFGIIPYAAIGVGVGMNYSTGANNTNNTIFALTAPYAFGMQFFGYSELNGLIVDCYYKNYSWAWTLNNPQGEYIENPACYGITLKFALTGLGG